MKNTSSSSNTLSAKTQNPQGNPNQREQSSNLGKNMPGEREKQKTGWEKEEKSRQQ